MKGPKNRNLESVSAKNIIFSSPAPRLPTLTLCTCQAHHPPSIVRLKKLTERGNPSPRGGAPASHGLTLRGFAAEQFRNRSSGRHAPCCRTLGLARAADLVGALVHVRAAIAALLLPFASVSIDLCLPRLALPPPSWRPPAPPAPARCGGGARSWRARRGAGGREQYQEAGAGGRERRRTPTRGGGGWWPWLWLGFAFRCSVAACGAALPSCSSRVASCGRSKKRKGSWCVKEMCPDLFLAQPKRPTAYSFRSITKRLHFPQDVLPPSLYNCTSRI
jgi:hypothetical protein